MMKTASVERRVQAPPTMGPLRVAVVGCGAMAREFHLPVLAGCGDVRVVALVDRDVARAAELAQAYDIERILPDTSELHPDWVDGAVVATPPVHHAPGSIELMRRGIHVLVEKPLALTEDEAVAMLATAREADVVLTVGLFRRLFPSMRMLRGLVSSRLLGDPVEFDVEAGSVYGWPLTTLANMRKPSGGGGVFMDMAPHLLDQILFAVPGELDLVDYFDNARGGIESDCVLRLRLHHGGRIVNGRVELSRTRKLRNTVRIECERGVLEFSSGDRFRVTLKPHGLEVEDEMRGCARPVLIQAGWADEPETTGFAAYREQLDDWVSAIRTGRRPWLHAESARPVVGFIERCYRSVRPLSEPWVDEGLQRVAAGTVAATAKDVRPGRVLVTGATGFIGCRVAEILALRESWDVRALVRSAGSTSRLARLPVEMVLGDLRRPDELCQAVQGCDAVVHCAIGTAYGNRKEVFDVTVKGTQRLANAAKAAGVRRFVHVSTVAVHGKDVIGTIDEDTPCRPHPGDDYSESKAEAERVIAQAVRSGLPAVTLRPANVYGPFGNTLITRPLQHLMRGTLVVRDGDVRVANLIYVDNLVQAIACALAAPADAAVGESFVVSDGDSMTWSEFYGAFACALDVLPPATLGPPAIEAQPVRRPPLRWAVSWFQAWKELFTSAEARALAKRYLQTDPLGRAPRWMFARLPTLERRLQRLLGAGRPLVYKPHAATTADVGRMVMNPIAAVVNSEKAHRRLGFAPIVPTHRAIELTVQWLKNARLIDLRPD